MHDPRYARQIVLKEWGTAGQEQLKASRVLLVGLGGLGSPAALYLAAAGVGTLGLIDPDQVDLSNLQRQVLYDTADAGAMKVERAAARLQALNPELQLELYPERFCAANALSICSRYDLIIDGSDNFACKFLVNDVCVKLRKPLVYGSILRWEGQLAVFWAPHGPCYRCLFPEPPKAYVPNCAEAGVIGALAGTLGSLQALEAMKVLVSGMPPYTSELRPLLGRLWLLRSQTMESQTLRIPKNPDCTVCSKPPEEIPLRDEKGFEGCALGLTEVKADDLLPEQAWTQYLCIDVREQVEWDAGHIPGAIHRPLSLLPHSKPGDWPSDERPWLLYCQGGVRSRRAYDILKSQGHTIHGHIQEGFRAWRGPIERASPRA